MSSSIRWLSPGTVTGVQHCSLISSWSAVRALCSNSVEAGAKSVAVKVDLSPQAIRIQVIDDGVGMSKEDLAVVGRQHWGSKQTHQAESLKWLRRLSDQVTITSRVRARGSFKVLFKRGVRGAVTEEEGGGRGRPGTTVTLTGYLAGLPVRRLRLQESAQLSQLRRGTVALGLAWPHVRFTLTNLTSGTPQQVLLLPGSGCQLAVLAALPGWRLDAGAHLEVWEEGAVRVEGAVGKEQHYDSRLQFVSINRQPLSRHFWLTQRIHKLLVTKETYRGLRSIKANPVFALNIEIPEDQVEIMERNGRTVINLKNKEQVVNIIEANLGGRTGVSTPKSKLNVRSLCMTGVKPLPASPPADPEHDEEEEDSTWGNLIGEENEEQEVWTYTPRMRGGRTSIPVYKRKRLTDQTEKQGTGNGRIHFQNFTAIGRTDELQSAEELSRTLSCHSHQNIFSEDIFQETEENYENSFLISGWINPCFKYIKSPKTAKFMDLDWNGGSRVHVGMVMKTVYVGQVENKVLASVSGTQLLLWDQHAVHERIRVENLIRDAMTSDGTKVKATNAPDWLCMDPCGDGGELTAIVSQPQGLAAWGLAVVPLDSGSLLVTEVPLCLESARPEERMAVVKAALVELASTPPLSRPALPSSLQLHLATKACRGAIMFGDPVAADLARDLLRDLALCHAPFQCAHGRLNVSIACDTDVCRKVVKWGKSPIKW